MRFWTALLAAVVFSTAGLVSTVNAKFDAGLINVSFGSKDIVPEGKAATGADKDKWNCPDGASGDNVELTDAKGDKSDVKVSYAAAGAYDAPDAGFIGTAWEKLLRKYLYSNEAKTVTLTGLTPGAHYDLYLYSASNADNRQTKFTVGTDMKITVYKTDNKELMDTVNYAKFTATADADGKVTITYEGLAANEGEVGEGNLNGLQITPAAK